MSIFLLILWHFRKWAMKFGQCKKFWKIKATEKIDLKKVKSASNVPDVSKFGGRSSSKGGDMSICLGHVDMCHWCQHYLGRDTS